MENQLNIDLIDLNKNYFVEASAGTGKTYNIKKLVYRLLSEKPLNYSLDNIVIVTYTEKAVEELKSRIREEIYEQYTVNKKLDPSTINFNDANIFTIHSFCQKCLDEFFFTLRRTKNSKLVDDTVLYSFINDFLHKEGKYELLCNIKKDYYLYDEKKLVNLIHNFLSKYYLDKDFQEDESIITLDNKYMFTLEDFDRFVSHDSLEDYYNYVESNIFSDEHKGIYKLLKVFETKLDLKYYDTLKKNFPKDIKITGSFKDTGKLDIDYSLKQTIIDLHWLLNFKSKHYTKTNVDNVHGALDNILINQFIKELYQKWIIYKKDNSFLEFSDLIRDIREDTKAKDSKILELLKKKYKYAIIDEFQDTNQLQWDIFSHIFMQDDDHHIFCVGDPKQSIYSFQGTDLQVYTDAKNQTSFIQQSLNDNHRASSSMIECCNTIFSKDVSIGNEYAINKEPYFDNSITFSPATFPSASKSMRYLKYKGTRINEPLLIVAKDNNFINEKEYAKVIAEKIIDYCTVENGKTHLTICDYKRVDGDLVPEPEDNVTFNSFAVLGKNRSYFSEIINEFKKLGIPFKKYKDKNLYQNYEIQQWIVLLKALNCEDFTGSRRNYFRKALMTKFFNKKIDDISLDKYEKDDTDEIRLFQKWKDLIRFKSWELLFDSIVNDSNLQHTLLNELNSESLNKFYQIEDLCIDYMYDCDSIQLLIKHLNGLSLNYESDDEDGGIVQIGTSNKAVTFITIHSSKGLEYPIVFSIDEFKDGYNNNKNKVSVNKINKSGKWINVLRNDIDIKLLNDERRRLTYVNYTRAKYMLVLPYMKPNKLVYSSEIVKSLLDNPRNSDVINYVDKYDDKYYEINRDVVRTILDNTVLPINTKTVETNCKLVINNVQSLKTYKNSYSSLSHPKKYNTLSEYDDEDDLDDLIDISSFDSISKQINGKYDTSKFCNDYKGYPKGAKVGLAIHGIFEDLDYSNYSINLENIINKRFKQEISEPNIEIVEQTKDIINNVLNAEIPMICGSKECGQFYSLKEINNDNKYTELGFDYRVSEKFKNYLNGSIDLIYQYNDKYCIVDWKTDSIDDEVLLSYNDINDLKRCVDCRYSIQRVLYSYTLIKWLSYILGKTPEEVFNEHFGGIHYIFVKGCISGTSNGVYSQTWNSFQDLVSCYNMIRVQLMKD